MAGKYHFELNVVDELCENVEWTLERREAM